MFLTEMLPHQLEDAVRKKLPLIAAVGSVEYHGGQLPLGTDLFITEMVAKGIEKRIPCVVALSFVFSPTGYAVSGPEKGTVDISVSLFTDYCAEILENYDRMGFERIIVLVHHQGGNIAPMINTAVMERRMYSVKDEKGYGWWTAGDRPVRANIEVLPAMLDTHFFGGHGGKGETEAVMASRPELVDMERFKKGIWWNDTAPQADADYARECLDTLLGRWAEKLGGAEK